MVIGDDGVMKHHLHRARPGLPSCSDSATESSGRIASDRAVFDHHTRTKAAPIQTAQQPNASRPSTRFERRVPADGAVGDQRVGVCDPHSTSPAAFDRVEAGIADNAGSDELQITAVQHGDASASVVEGVIVADGGVLDEEVGVPLAHDSGDRLGLVVADETAANRSAPPLGRR